MIQPIQKDDALLADVKRAAESEPDSLHLWWLGQSGFLCQCQGRHLLFDPYLSDSLTRKYAATDKPHTRMTERVVDPGRLDFIDVVTSSHNHTDHLDGETLSALFHANPELILVLPAANREFAVNRLGGHREAMAGVVEGKSITVKGMTFTGIPAAHEERSPEFQGFVVQLGPWTLYHSGDTVLFPGLTEALAEHSIDIAFLPINGRAPERRVAGNLNGAEAAQLGKAIGARFVIPCHFEMFTFNTEPPDRFEAACRATGQGFKTLKAGERFSIPAP